MTSYKTCAVPMCRSTTIKYPDKLFIHVPKCPKRRKQWLQLARRDKLTSDKSAIFFCEDHFDLPNDMENYIQYSVMGSVGQIRMKPDCLPSKFQCQPDRIKPHADMDKQQCLQATSTPAISTGMNVATCIVVQDDGLNIKDECADTDLDIGPTVLQHMDATYRPIQPDVSIIKQESRIKDNNRSRIKDNNMNAVLCGGVMEEIIEDERRADTDAQRSNKAAQTEQRARSQSCCCDKCGKTYGCKVSLKAHYRNLHSTESHKCTKCNKKFPSKAYLYMHTRNAHSEQQYECAVCKKIYKSKLGLTNHVNQVHRPRPPGSHSQLYICGQCSQRCISKKSLAVHCSRVHGKESHKCTECDKEYKCKAYLRNHVRKVHSEQRYECAVCMSAFKSKLTLKNHIQIHHAHKSVADTDDQRSKEASQSEQRARSQLYSCDKCVKTYSSKASLRVHYRNLHSTESHECTRCKKIFPSKGYLCKHTSYAHSEQQYECAVCKKIYGSKKALYHHVYHAHRPRPAGSRQLHTCTNCGSKFDSKQYCQRHEKRGKCTRPTASNINAVASTSLQQHNVVIVKEELADGELDLGPVVFQHMDCNYRPYKLEPLLE